MGVGNALVLSGGVEEDLYFTDGSEEEDVSGRAPRGQRQLVLDEGKSGIVWKYANQGKLPLCRPVSWNQGSADGLLKG
jgi:hypothetical protein